MIPTIGFLEILLAYAPVTEPTVPTKAATAAPKNPIPYIVYSANPRRNSSSSSGEAIISLDNPIQAPTVKPTNVLANVPIRTLWRQ